MSVSILVLIYYLWFLLIKLFNIIGFNKLKYNRDICIHIMLKRNHLGPNPNNWLNVADLGAVFVGSGFGLGFWTGGWIGGGIGWTGLFIGGFTGGCNGGWVGALFGCVTTGWVIVVVVVGCLFVVVFQKSAKLSLAFGLVIPAPGFGCLPIGCCTVCPGFGLVVTFVPNILNKLGVNFCG